MIPLSDANPRLTSSIVTFLIVASTLAIFFLYQETQIDEVATALSVIPCELSTGEPVSGVELREGICKLGDAPLFPEKSLALSVVASIFLHGSALHVIGNMWYLWIFGNNVEDAFGRMGFVLFYLLAGVAAVAGFVVTDPLFTGPLIGASGAVAGVMGAYIVLFPKKRVRGLLGFFPVQVPAWVFLGFWFASQFFVPDVQVAWQAHVAGFAFGTLAALLVRRPARVRLNQLRFNLQQQA
jgi:membrane associated rhomboid family serine protease